MSMSRLPTTAPPCSRVPRGNAVLTATAARAATLIAPGSCLPESASVPGRRRWSVGACSHAGALEPGKRGRRWETGA